MRPKIESGSFSRPKISSKHFRSSRTSTSEHDGNGRPGLDTRAALINVLTTTQRRFLQAFFESQHEPDPFYLSGGTALAAYHLGHRYSDDLDFFPRDRSNLEPAAHREQLERALGRSHLSIERSVRRGDHLQYFLSGDAGAHPLVRVEFLFDTPEYFVAPQRRDEAFVDGLVAIGVNKLTVLGRQEPKDYVDVFEIVRTGGLSIDDLGLPSSYSPMTLIASSNFLTSPTSSAGTWSRRSIGAPSSAFTSARRSAFASSFHHESRVGRSNRPQGQRSQAIQHPVDDDAGDRDVEPERERPARDPDVAVETPGQRAPDRRERQRHDGGGQHDVRHQQREVHGTDPPLAGEWPRARVEVIHDVGDQEDGGQNERAHHARQMRDDVPATDEDVAGREQDRAAAVQHRIQLGQRRDVEPARGRGSAHQKHGDRYHDRGRQGADDRHRQPIVHRRPRSSSAKLSNPLSTAMGAA